MDVWIQTAGKVAVVERNPVIMNPNMKISSSPVVD